MRVLAIALTAVLIVLSVTTIVGAFAVLARRLLGLRFGMVRLLLAGLAGSMPDDGGAITRCGCSSWPGPAPS